MAALALPFLPLPGGRPAFLTPPVEAAAFGVDALVVAGAMVLDVCRSVLNNCFEVKFDARDRFMMESKIKQRGRDGERRMGSAAGESYVIDLWEVTLGRIEVHINSPGATHMLCATRLKCT